jgi:hypothetical protein
MKKRLRRRYRTVRYIIYKEKLIDFHEHFWTFLGSFVGLALIGLINSEYITIHDNLFIIGSFGASSGSPELYCRLANIKQANMKRLTLLLSFALITVIPAFAQSTGNPDYKKS